MKKALQGLNLIANVKGAMKWFGISFVVVLLIEMIAAGTIIIYKTI